jgi:hypothetical protein|nr:MAG TPA: hypothetical protein [Caudoviricetes sp.]
MSDDEKNRKLENFLERASSINEKFEKNSELKKLEEIYEGNFRHKYSIIFKKLVELDKQLENFSIEMLSENIFTIFLESQKTNDCKIKKSVEKLYDHVNLDVARIGYMKAIDKKTEDNRKNQEKDKIHMQDDIADLLLKSKKLKDESQKLREKLEKQIDKSEKLEQNLKDYNKEVFGIMGVFLTIFSIIGLNFDVYKAVSALSLSKILLLFVGINLSLFLILNFMFGFIKDILISKNISVTNKNSYFWHTFIGLLVIGVVIVINMRYVPETRVQKIIELEKKVKILEEKLNQQE